MPRRMMRSVWSWLSRFFPARTLDAVGRGARCDVVVKVVSADTIDSTIAPTIATAIRWTLLYEETARGDDRGGAPVRRLRPFASGWRGGPIIGRAACGRTIEIPLEGARLIAPIDPEDGVPLGTSPASAAVYGEAAARASSTAGPVYLREHSITHGQKLVVRAFVEPAEPERGYRHAAPILKAQLRASRDVVLEDRLD